MDSFGQTARQRPAVAVGLILAVFWITVCVYESFTGSAFEAAGWYESLAGAVETAAFGVAGIVALVWLVEQSRLLERG